MAMKIEKEEIYEGKQGRTYVCERSVHNEFDYSQPFLRIVSRIEVPERSTRNLMEVVKETMQAMEQAGQYAIPAGNMPNLEGRYGPNERDICEARGILVPAKWKDHTSPKTHPQSKELTDREMTDLSTSAVAILARHEGDKTVYSLTAPEEMIESLETHLVDMAENGRELTLF